MLGFFALEIALNFSDGIYGGFPMVMGPIALFNLLMSFNKLTNLKIDIDRITDELEGNFKNSEQESVGRRR